MSRVLSLIEAISEKEPHRSESIDKSEFSEILALVERNNRFCRQEYFSFAF
jgi:hypothetical protein